MEGISFLQNLVIGMIVFGLVVGGFTFVLVDIFDKSDGVYDVNMNNDNMTSTLNAMRDKYNRSIRAAEDVGKEMESNRSVLGLDTIEEATRGGITAVRFTLDSFDSGREVLEETQKIQPWMPKWMFSALIALLIFMVGISLAIIFLNLRK